MPDEPEQPMDEIEKDGLIQDPSVLPEIKDMSKFSDDGMKMDKNGVFTTGDTSGDLRWLEPEKARPYIVKLSERLESTKNMINDTRYSNFLDKVLASYHILEMKYDSQKDGYTRTPFGIDPTESGFPSFMNFVLLQDEKSKSPQALKEIGDIGAVIKSASDLISQSIFPVKERRLLAEYQYYKRILNLEPIKEFEFGDIVPESHKETSRFRSFKTEWYGLDKRFSGFVFYKMNFTVNAGSEPLKLDGQSELANVIESNFRQPIDRLFLEIDKLRGLSPKKITKYSLGPYMNTDTMNEMRTNDLFRDYQRTMKKGEDEPFLLKVSKEKIESVGTTPKIKSFFQKLNPFGMTFTTQVPSKVYQRDYFLTNFRITQIVSGASEGTYGVYTPDVMYGLTKQGVIAAKGMRDRDIGDSE